MITLKLNKSTILTCSVFYLIYSSRIITIVFLININQSSWSKSNLPKHFVCYSCWTNAKEALLLMGSYGSKDKHVMNCFIEIDD